MNVSILPINEVCDIFSIAYFSRRDALANECAMILKQADVDAYWDWMFANEEQYSNPYNFFYHLDPNRTDV